MIGNIASIVTQSYFMAKFGLGSQTGDEYANTKGWLVSISTAGAVFGCLGVSQFFSPGCCKMHINPSYTVLSHQRQVRSTMGTPDSDRHIHSRNPRSRPMQWEPLRPLCIPFHLGPWYGTFDDRTAGIYHRGINSLTLLRSSYLHSPLIDLA